MVEKLLTEDDVSKIVHRAVSTLRKDRVYGVGIPFIKVGRKCFYRESDVDAYFAGLPAHRSTSELTAKQGTCGRPRKRPDDPQPEPQPAAE